MAEIRLICPGCAAEYRVPDSAIPPDGREVECSACGHVWHASATPARMALVDAVHPDNPGPAAAAVPLNRPLPPSVLDILRDEVEHERRARAAERTDAPRQPGKTPPESDRPDAASSADPDWPATTITRHIEPRPREGDAGMALPAPAPADGDASVMAAPASPVSPPVARPAAPRRAKTVSRRRGGYGAGFGLAAMLTGAGLALYVLAPTLAAEGIAAEALTDARAGVDSARLWLQDRVQALLR